MTDHKLAAAGAAHDETGERIFLNSTTGWGRAKCSCGWLSEEAEYGRVRKRLHAQHIEDIEELVGGLGLASPPEMPEVLEKAVSTGQQLSDGDAVTRGILWPSSVPKIWFKVCAKDGAQTICDRWGLTRTSDEAMGVVEITGREEDVDTVVADLPQVWGYGNEHLKTWRRTDVAYRDHDFTVPDDRREALAMEKTWWRGFFKGVAGFDIGLDTETHADAYVDGHTTGKAYPND